MSRTKIAHSGLLAVALALAGSSFAVAQDGEAADPAENPNTGEVSDTLVAQDGALAVYDEHIRALNACEWGALLAQYPNDAEIHLPGGTVVKGRQAIGDLFAGFVLPVEEGGLCGITFSEESRFEVGGTEAVQWVAEADFLAEPYRGSDAYISDGQYMAAMVSTFDGADLVMAGADEGMADEDMDDTQGDGTEGTEGGGDVDA
jgi:hypothetical protein